ncbi:hypothetical protein ACIU1J_26485 [Azospirillum doebereinerae]|uniref:hypothetical protein n=1 Tax=Azospirillum doebereinerae TaxID=92933 RepID=UPI001EE5B409|nr:hypothetical protein [Azospirillum doebereinerae]MCG5243625.1 hypothetical protein [Azospirillum doebereinerae]
MSNKQVTFIQNRRPGLQSGTYTIEVEQHVGVGDGETYSAVRHFQVRGERFRVPDADIHSVFPPDKSTGPYRGSVPHVMFNRAMLPWLSPLAANAPESATWLAVLTFDAGEAPPLVTRTVRDLVKPGVTIWVPGRQTGQGTGTLPAQGTLSYPFDPDSETHRFELEYGESPDDDIVTVDMPVALFKRVAPSLPDMAFLAHVREVDLTAGRSAAAGVGGKASSGRGDDDEVEAGQFATVLGNRLIAPGLAGTALLVSLEGLGDHLVGGSKVSDLDRFAVLRLVVLKAWTFSAIAQSDSVLRNALDHLCDTPDDGSVQLQVPTPRFEAADVEPALAAQANGTVTPTQATLLLQHALALGYVPLGHHMRTGGRDVSWYRGPMAPVPVPLSQSPPLSAPLESSDAALAYNPETGLFDVSYAAAWQLGQVLALSDAGFSTSLCGWQRNALEQTAAAGDRLSSSVAHLQSLAVRPAVARDAEATPDPAPLFARILGARLARYARHHTRAALDGPPDAVLAWLDRLKHFRRVPMRYLIPDPRMLPPESLRFFHLDPNWVNALLDGACSVARYVSGSPITPTPGRYAAGPESTVSGCLLNSAVVLGWPGLRITAWSGNTELKRVYDDTLTDGLRLVLFEGNLDKLDIFEGGEGLHFGANDDTAPPTVALRRLTGTDAGKIINADGSRANVRVTHYHRIDGAWQSRDGVKDSPPPPATVSAPTRGADGRVLDIAATAQAVRRALIERGEITDQAPFTSAEMALELVKPVVHVSYQLGR